VPVTLAAGFELHDSLGGFEADWDELARESDSIFATREWIDCWWRHFGRGRPLLVGAWRDPAGRRRVLVPMYLAAAKPLSVLRFLGHGPSDRLGPVYGDGWLDQARLCWSQLLRGGHTKWDLMVADDLPAGLDWAGSTGAKVIGGQHCPVTTLSKDGWLEWLAGRSRNLRATLSRSMRRLEQMGPVVIRLADDRDRLADDLAVAMELHAARWRPAGRRGGFFGREGFHQEFAGIAMDNGWLRLMILEVGGTPAAMLYNFRFGSAESFYLSGRDPALENVSVGLLMQAEAIRRAHEDGLTEYRFLRGAEPYKYRFANRDDRLQSVAAASGPAGCAALAAIRRLHDVPPWVRSRVPSPYSWGTGAVPLWGRP
jgi:CelD/BcsL family acetyltransferase involved in cellulose biosynthesis